MQLLCPLPGGAALSRLLLPLCVLLLVVGVTAASAVAPAYGPGEVTISVGAAPHSTTRFEQMTSCSARGGVLVPTVTNAVFMKVSDYLHTAGISTGFGYMGGSTLLSSVECTTSAPSLSCIWYWDQGRYAGAENALAFYKGNRDPVTLPGAKMVSTLVGNYWRIYGGSKQQYPGSAMQRHCVLFRGWTGGTFGWADSSDSTWSYGTVSPADYYMFCAVDQGTRMPMTTTTTTVTPAAAKSDGVSVPLVVGVSVAAAVVAGAIVVLVLSLPCCCGWCCSAGAAVGSNPSEASTTNGSFAARSQRGAMSRGPSFHGGGGDFDEYDNGLFMSDAANKHSCSRHSSFRGDAAREGGEAEAADWQSYGDAGSVAGSQYARSADGNDAALLSQVPTMMAPAQSAVVTRDAWKGWERPMPVSVFTVEPRESEMQRRSSSRCFSE